MESFSALLVLMLLIEVIVLPNMLGHLVTAWCLRAPVIFRIGLGPALPGCRFRLRRTTFVLAWIPLGGYVTANPKWLPGKSDVDSQSTAPVSVWRRAFVSAGGIIGSIVLGWFCFT